VRKTKTMKKLDTLKKELATVTNEELATIIDNENIVVTDLTEFEKLSVLMYRELQKALQSKKYSLLLDCNYADSKFVQNEILKVDYYRLATFNAMIQIYVRHNSFRICTSASKSNREQFKLLESELQFVTKYDKKTNRAKTTERINIAYDELFDVIMQVIAILKSTATTKTESKKEEQ
jgi:hypothetical protein